MKVFSKRELEEIRLKMQSVLKRIQEIIATHDPEGERYKLDETPHIISEESYYLNIFSPLVDGSIGNVIFDIHGQGNIISMPTDAMLSAKIAEHFHLEQGVK